MWNVSSRSLRCPDDINALKQQPGEYITLGGVDLPGTFRRPDSPVVIGHGRRLFGTADHPADRELVENQPFGSGVVLLRYGLPVVEPQRRARGHVVEGWPSARERSSGDPARPPLTSRSHHLSRYTRPMKIPGLGSYASDAG